MVDDNKIHQNLSKFSLKFISLENISDSQRKIFPGGLLHYFSYLNQLYYFFHRILEKTSSIFLLCEDLSPATTHGNFSGKFHANVDENSSFLIFFRRDVVSF